MAEARRRFSLRPWLRALHRDLGNLAVGLTLVYALSGLTVNHIADWDPNFTSYESTHQLGPLAGEDDDIARVVAEKLAIKDKPTDVYRAAADQLEIVFSRRTLHVNPGTGQVIDEGQKPRLLLRVANWLHLNRGKKSWTYAADAYAAALLILSATGLFMIPGRKGLIGRGGIFVLLGIAIPVAYVQLSGGPEAASGKKGPPAGGPRPAAPGAP
jgi:hypothetical protein